MSRCSNTAPTAGNRRRNSSIPELRVLHGLFVGNGNKKTGSSSQGMTVRTRGIFGISTTVGFRGFSSSSLYLAGTEICWAPVKEHLQRACARNLVRNPLQQDHAGSPLSSTRQEGIHFLHGVISADNT